MAHYRVSHASTHNITLVDDTGRLHVARSLHGSLRVGAELHGPRPVPGFALLSNASTLDIHRVIFEEVDCSPLGDLTAATKGKGNAKEVCSPTATSRGSAAHGSR